MQKILFSTGKDDWETPKEVFEKLDKEFHFTLDPCASNSNHKCDKYFTIQDDGLSKDWLGETVFCNPPYSKKTKNNPGQEAWIKKCYEESRKPNTTVVMLIPVRTDTRAFHDYIYHKAEIRFIKGRVKFINNGVVGNKPTFPSMIVIFRSEDFVM